MSFWQLFFFVFSPSGVQYGKYREFENNAIGVFRQKRRSLRGVGKADIISVTRERFKAPEIFT